MPEELPDYAARNRDGWTKANTEYTARRAREAWSAPGITWGV